MKLEKKLLPLVFPILIIIFWFIITEVFVIWPPYILPSPVVVCQSAYILILNGQLLKNTISSLVKVLLGILLASVIAIPLGVFLGWNETWDRFTSLVISVLRPVPPIAWIPFAILWFGIGLFSSVFVIFLGCVFPLLVSTIDGVKRTDKVLVEAAQTLGADNWTVISKVVVPSSIPHIISGLKVGVGIALMCTVSAEMIASSDGLGHMILTASNLFDPGTMVVGILVIGIIGIVFDLIFRKLQSSIFW
ncbi:MAG: ABC transporter permease [Methanobacteriaceae archaeon]|nr:ABC transporter permease [Methanobacteriaceae archaeon]